MILNLLESCIKQISVNIPTLQFLTPLWFIRYMYLIKSLVINKVQELGIGAYLLVADGGGGLGGGVDFVGGLPGFTGFENPFELSGEEETVD